MLLSKGYKDAMRAKKDTALAPPRRRKHCQVLVADLKGEVK
jgi:hypothetical protein